VVAVTTIVRWAKVDALDPDLVPEWLTPAERGRHRSLRQAVDRRQFVGARQLLRDTLVELLGGSADDVELHQQCDRCGGAHGRPMVRIAGRPGPHVSTTHAGGLVAVAIASNPVGVDLEPVGDTTTDTGDLVTWVRTEAVLKATGHGLDVDPRLVGISGPDAAPRLETWNGPGRRPAVTLADLDLGGGLVGCVARLGRGRAGVDVAERTLAVLPSPSSTSEPAR
jgi:4'-phosphopantetheinyl transferase